MKKKLIGILACSILITTIISASGMINTNYTQKNISFIINDAVVPRDLLNILNFPVNSPDPGFYETCEYMIGTVAVGVILPESTGGGSTEDWTTTEENQVTNEITAALNWWKSQNTNAGINFVYDWNYAVSTVYEPISGASVFTDPTWEATWVKDVMSSMGYSSGDEFARVRNYINNLRTTKGTDWAFAVFVVDSSADSDGCFSDATATFLPCAWGYVGGPWVVMTYDNNGWGISAMDQVMAHETGHIFWATDEYDTTAEYSGYLNAQDITGSGGLMDTNTLSLSSGTKLQVGWRDTDLDSLDDIIDTNPDTTLNPYTPDPTTQTTITYTGSSTVNPYTNNNPKAWNTGNDVTINTISKVEYRVNSGSWTGALAVDGLFDEPTEDFTMTIGPISPGTYTIEARAMNSVSNYDLTPSLDTITITANNAPNTPTNPNPSQTLIHRIMQQELILMLI